MLAGGVPVVAAQGDWQEEIQPKRTRLAKPEE